MHTQPTIAVMIVTNHPIMRDGLRLRVQQEPDMRVVCEASDLAQALRDFDRFRPDVVVIDLQLPPGASLQVMHAIRQVSLATPLVVLTNYPGELDTPPRAGQAPVLVLSKTPTSKEVIIAIRTANTGSRADEHHH
jgi:two-component system, NarL family, response regulator